MEQIVTVRKMSRGNGESARNCHEQNSNCEKNVTRKW